MTDVHLVRHRVGLRRLYAALGFSVAPGHEIHEEFDFGDFRVEFYVGLRPKYNVTFTRSDKYILPTGASQIVHMESKSNPDETPYAGRLFVELTCFSDVQFSPDVIERFLNGEKDAQETLLAPARTLATRHERALDVVAGTIGLRFHRQFVLDRVHEELLVPRGEQWTIELVGPWTELLECGELNAEGVVAIREMMPAIGGAAPDALDRAGDVLSWLLRAWAERDPYSKFVSLFIPLEMVLQGTTPPADEESRQAASRITELVQRSGGEDRERLSSFLKHLLEQQGPTLNQRFETFAKQAGIAGWERDVAAFRKFNRTRNQLLHRGASKIALAVEVEGEMRPLEDLVERYVCKALFDDVRVYKSKWRPQPGAQGER